MKKYLPILNWERQINLPFLTSFIFSIFQFKLICFFSQKDIHLLHVICLFYVYNLLTITVDIIWHCVSSLSSAPWCYWPLVRPCLGCLCSWLCGPPGLPLCYLLWWWAGMWGSGWVWRGCRPPCALAGAQEWRSSTRVRKETLSSEGSLTSIPTRKL